MVRLKYQKKCETKNDLNDYYKVNTQYQINLIIKYFM